MKTLIVYYGYGEHTKMIAEKIKEELSCDILRLETKVPYSTDYQTVVDETEDNVETKKTPEIKDISVKIEDYETIIIGTPVWWYTITPPIRTFLTKYNLRGKKIYAFATNAGWLGETFEEIKELIGKVESTISIKFTTNSKENKMITKEEELEKWIQSIKEV